MAQENVYFNLEEIELEELIPRCAMLKSYGWRLCQIHAVRIKGGYELTYTLAKDYEMHNFKVTIGEEESVPSLTPCFACAWMYENEIVELFGANIQGIRMNYEKKLYKIHVDTPFK